jgi:hypothetical protein
MAVECDTSHKKKETQDADDDIIDLCLEDDKERIPTTLKWKFDTTTSGGDEQQQNHRPRRSYEAQDGQREDAQRRQEMGLTLRSGGERHTLEDIQQEVNAHQQQSEGQHDPKQKSRYGNLKVNATKSQGTGTTFQIETNTNWSGNGDEEQHQEAGGAQPAAGTKYEPGDAGGPGTQKFDSAAEVNLARVGDRRDRDYLRVRDSREASAAEPGGAAAEADKGTPGLRPEDSRTRTTTGARRPSGQHQHRRNSGGATVGELALRRTSTGAGTDTATVKTSYNKANVLSANKQGHDPYG